MPAARKSAGAVAAADEPDALDNYFVDSILDDPFASPPPATKNKRKSDDAGLGIDKEVDVTKKARTPAVKLDEDRLLSDAGIPKLRRRAQGLKIKGKGHEFSDMTRLLSLYQLWLDDLFPKARFLDALAMVEKAGHKKRLVAARNDWLNERNPQSSRDGDGDGNDEYDALFGGDEDDRALAGEAVTAGRPGAGRRLIYNRDGSGSGSGTGAGPHTPPPRDNHPDDFSQDDDLYGVTPRVLGPRPGLTALSSGGGAPDDDEDDLDALMAEAGHYDARAATEAGQLRRDKSAADGEPDDLDEWIAEAQDARPSDSIFGNPGAATSGPSATDWDDDEAALREMEGF